MRRLTFLFLSVLAAACSASTPKVDEPRFDPTTLGPDDPRAHCAPGRWCWVDGEPFVAMHGLSADNVVAASARGEVWRFTESGWVALNFPARLSEWSLFAAGSNDVWVAGDGRLFHHDGAAWTERDAAASGVPSGRWPRVLVGSGPSDVWAYRGADTTLMHFDGTRWAPQPLDAGLWAGDVLPVSARETWVVASAEIGRSLSILRFDGAEWVSMASMEGPRVPARLIAVDGEVWVTGSAPQRFAGGEWFPLDRARFLSDATTTRLVSGAGNLVELPAGLGCESAHIAGATVFCVDRRGTISHSNDRIAWTRSALDTLESSMPVAAWDDYAPNVWAGDAEFAWGLAPESAIRFRPRMLPVDEPYGPWLVLERATVTGADLTGGGPAVFGPVAAPGSSEPFLAGADIDIDGAAGGPIWVSADGALHTLSSDGVLTRVDLPAPLADVRVLRVAAIDADSAIVIAELDDTGVSLVLRVDGGSARALMERDTGYGEGTVQFEDVAVDTDGGLWVIGNADREDGRSEGVATLFYSRDGAEWASRDLWSTWGNKQLVVDGDQLWIVSATEPGRGLYRLPRTVMDTTGAIVPDDVFGDFYIPSGSNLAYESVLHVDESGVWLSSNDRAIWLPR